MNFIGAQMPELANHFHYRKIDISAIALLERTAWSWVGFNPPEKQYGHTALADIQESFDELKSYTKTLQTMIENMKF
jgi:oligoribonuclease